MKASIVNALRKATDVAIRIDSHSITLVPHLKTGSGGEFDWVAQTPRPPQNFSLEPVGATLSGVAGTGGGIVNTEGANIHAWDYELVGRYDSQMAIGDTWTRDGTIYRIVAIKPVNNYEKRSVVSAIGKDPNYGS